jgi:two-component sensor histidine kinase
MKKATRTILVSLFVLFTLNNFAVNTIDSLNTAMWQEVFSNPRKAIAESDKIIGLGVQENDQKGLARTYGQLGVAYDLLGVPDSALPFFYQAITIQEKIKDSTGLSFSYNNIGLMYYALYDYTPALKNLRTSLTIDKQIKDDESAAGSLINIGIILTYLDSLDQAVSLYEEAYLLYESSENSRGMITASSNMAKVYYANKNYTKALENYLKVKTYYQENGSSPEAISANYNSLANTYSKLNQYNKALTYAHKDLAFCNLKQLVNKKQFAYETLNEVYSANGNYKKAHEYLLKYTNLRDSLLNENRTTVIEDMKTKYETERKEAELVQVKLEKEAETLKHKTEQQFFYGAAFLLIILLVFLVWGYSSKRKINGLLLDKNNLNEAIIEQKGVMLGEVHHRVKNNLQLISSMVSLQASEIRDNVAASFLEDIQKRINAIAELHQFLYQGDDVEKVNLDLYITSLVNGLKHSIKQEGLKINTTITPLSLDVKTAVPVGLIVNELVTNALKYAFKDNEKGEISVCLNKQENQLVLKVSDNGIGMSDKKATSFGTKMIRSLCRQLKADWDIKSENGVTHTFVINRFKNYE